MSERKRILMLVNWRLEYIEADDPEEQPSNKVVAGERYWFFRYWRSRDFDLDVVDFVRLPVIHSIEKRFLKFYVSQALRVLPVLDGYDLIVSHSAQSGLLLAFLRSMQGKKTPPHIIIDPGSFNGARERLSELFPIRLSLPSVAGVIGHSEGQVPYYRDVLSLPARRFRIVRVGVDTEFYSPPCARENGRYVVCLGYMKRDWATLLSAWEEIDSDAELLLLGKERLSRPVRGVRCMPYVSRSRLKEIISDAMFVVLPLPHYTYSFGQMSLLISQSLGKAVIATRVPALLDYGEDGEDVLFVEPYSVADIKDKMVRLLSEPAEAAALGRKARENVLSSRTTRHMGLALEDAVRELSKNI